MPVILEEDGEGGSAASTYPVSYELQCWDADVLSHFLEGISSIIQALTAEGDVVQSGVEALSDSQHGKMNTLLTLITHPQRG